MLLLEPSGNGAQGTMVPIGEPIYGFKVVQGLYSNAWIDFVPDVTGEKIDIFRILKNMEKVQKIC